MPRKPTKAHERLWAATAAAEKACEIASAKLVLAAESHREAQEDYREATDKLGALRRRGREMTYKAMDGPGS